MFEFLLHEQHTLDDVGACVVFSFLLFSILEMHAKNRVA